MKTRTWNIEVVLQKAILSLSTLIVMYRAAISLVDMVLAYYMFSGFIMLLLILIERQT